MSEGRRFYWAIAERIVDDEEIGRIAIVAENEVSALESGRWALIECLDGRYRSAEFVTRVEIATAI